MERETTRRYAISFIFCWSPSLPVFLILRHNLLPVRPSQRRQREPSNQSSFEIGTRMIVWPLLARSMRTVKVRHGKQTTLPASLRCPCAKWLESRKQAFSLESSLHRRDGGGSPLRGIFRAAEFMTSVLHFYGFCPPGPVSSFYRFLWVRTWVPFSSQLGSRDPCIAGAMPHAVRTLLFLFWFAGLRTERRKRWRWRPLVGRKSLRHL